jgi:hypothetical protein
VTGRFHTLVIMPKRKLLGCGLIHQFGDDLEDGNTFQKNYTRFGEGMLGSAGVDILLWPRLMGMYIENKQK